MRLAIDGRAIMQHPDGIGRYSKALIEGIAKKVSESKDIELYVYVTHEVFDFAGEPQCVQVVVPKRYVHPYTILGFHRRLHKDEIDVLFSPFFFSPVFFRGRTLLTVHDLMWSHYPQLQGPLAKNWNWLRWLTQRVCVSLSLRNASHVFCVSESTRSDLVSHYPKIGNRVSVTHLGIDHLPVVDSPIPIDERENFLLFVGNTKPYKNLDNVIRAYSILIRSGKHAGLKLVIPGRVDTCRAGIARLIAELGIENDVLLAGSVKDEELFRLYRYARALVFPSRYEGFGIPVLEAMHFGTPVITSNRSSLPEVAGDAALIADPEKPESIAEACERLLADAVIAESLMKSGRRRAAGFSWDSTVAQSWKIVQDLCRS